MHSDLIEERYNQKLTAKKSDIKEHLPTLYEYAKQCTHIAEFGVREVVSTWALLRGLRDNNQKTKSLISVDLEKSSNIIHAENAAKGINAQFQFIIGNDLEVDLEHDVDMLFIDTWHVYGHLKRELLKHAKSVRKWILLHDTEIDGVLGESIRTNKNIDKQSEESGIPIHEIRKGLNAAIEEFIIQGDANGNRWKIKKRFRNCNGLTILQKESTIH